MKPKKILGVIGDPIAHSLSPPMHNAGLQSLALPYTYKAFRLKKTGLKKFLAQLKQKNIAGLNVTIPHKQNVIPFMSSLTREAKLTGAVNTIIVKGTKLIGHNTDGLGYTQSLAKQAGFKVKDKSVLIIGAGGAARAIVVALAIKKAKQIIILNRTEQKANELASEFAKRFRQTRFVAVSFKNKNTIAYSKLNLVINTTAMGMKGVRWMALPFHKLSRRCLVSDIVYNPLITPLLKKAQKLKLATHPGWGMLLYQGALALEKWTGKKAPVLVMKQALLKEIS